MDRYTILMILILGIYTIIFTFFIDDKIMLWYLIGGIVFIGYSYTLMRRRYSKNLIVHSYLIIAPLYNFYVMLAFWDNSVASFCWLLPIPLGAYIFFSNKTVLWYITYTFLLIVIGYIIANTFSFDFPKHSQKEVIFTDTILIISNILVVSLLIFYKDKIRKLEILSQFEQKELKKIQKNKGDEAEVSSDNSEQDSENMEKLFTKIETAMTERTLFKDENFNLAKLSVALNINSTYISKAIRFKGYPNFNSYLNTYRISHVKKLFMETDFEKATLMYVYTEAGFSNQSTFNRVFKQIEGITPSEYIQNLHKNTDQ